MNGYKCSFCDAPGQFSGCRCGFAEYLGCSNQPSCGKCEKAHKTIGAFFRGLLTSQMQERSNSLRRRLFGILHSVLCENYFPEKRHLLNTLSRTSAFSPDERNFQGCVREVIRCLPANSTVADLLRQKINEAAIERFFETCSELMAADGEKNKLASDFVGFAREVTARERLKKYLGL